MDWYPIIKTLHIISATVLFGTGLGIAFFMLRSSGGADPGERYFAARTTVLADLVFTTPAVILQPLTGAWLVWHGGFDWSARWLVISILLYLLAGACWLPVVWIQLQLRGLARQALNGNGKLPERYHRLFRTWYRLGFPAFGALTAVFFLMVLRPV